jgi:hypothetical protein
LMKVSGLTMTNASGQSKNRDSTIIAKRVVAEIRRGLTFRGSGSSRML